MDCSGESRSSVETALRSFEALVAVLTQLAHYLELSCGGSQQTGATPMNITLLGNAIWGDNSSALEFDLGSGAKGRLSTVGNLLLDYGSTVIPVGQTRFLPDVTTAVTQSTLTAHLDDFRTLGAMDLAWNYPQLNRAVLTMTSGQDNA